LQPTTKTFGGEFSFPTYFTYSLSIYLSGGQFSLCQRLRTRRIWINNGHFRTSGLFQFFFSHLPMLVSLPAFFAGLMINARFRHKVASYVWILPVAILAVAFLFGPGMYPTMLWDSDLPASFCPFFGSEIQLEARGNGSRSFPPADWLHAYDQLTFSMPAYTAIVYSLGASLGMSSLTKEVAGIHGRF
jgi:hypothetical protein